jgi:hypothetical protein
MGGKLRRLRKRIRDKVFDRYQAIIEKGGFSWLAFTAIMISLSFLLAMIAPDLFEYFLPNK